MEYQLVIPKKVQKELKRIDKQYRPRILAAFVALKKNPFLGKKLEGKYKNKRSYRVWPYRIIYNIKEKESVILIIKIGHRQGVY